MTFHKLVSGSLCAAAALAAVLLSGAPVAAAPGIPRYAHISVIILENHTTDEIIGNAAAPNLTKLAKEYGFASNYYGIRHPSEPNYIWLEAGTNFGITNDSDPLYNHQNTTNHLSALLDKAGVSWRSYQEDINGLYVPLTSTNKYAPKHNPFVFFDDVTGTNNVNYAYGIAHNRPYPELAR